jgi:AcrR family transcriptional regulator
MMQQIVASTAAALPEVPLLSSSQATASLLPVQSRSGGRTRLQQRQKETSRERLIAAARDAFAESSYAGAAIDDIVRRANVNRSTFYRHFDSKFAVAKALFEPFWTELFAVYGDFAPSDPPADREIAAWIDRLLVFYRGHRPYFTTIAQIESLEPEGMRWGETIRLEVIRLLAERLPAFRHAASGAASAMSRVRVRLLMIELELCVFDLAFNPEAEREATIAVLGEEFRRLASARALR